MNVLNTAALKIEKTSPFEEILKWVGDDVEKVDLEFRKNLKSDVPIIAAIGATPIFTLTGRRPRSAQKNADFSFLNQQDQRFSASKAGVDKRNRTLGVL